jgi:hypothetical protein
MEGHHAVEQQVVLALGDGKASYTVRLHFAELDNVEPGKRVFDIAINGKPALKRVDVVKEAHKFPGSLLGLGKRLVGCERIS